MVDEARLIKLIYDGVQDDAAWSLALSQVAELARAAGAGLGIQDMKTHRFRSLGQFGIDTGLNATYQRLAAGNRIWQAIGAGKQALTDRMVMAKSDFVRTELYADWFAPQRFHSVMAAPTLFEENASAVIVAFRDAPRGDFEAADLARAERFAGHFGAALRFRFARERMAAELAAANFILDGLPDAIFLVSRNGRLRQANSAGKQMLASGTPVRLLKGRLELEKSELTERMQRMIGAARSEFRLPKLDFGSWMLEIRSGPGCAGAVGPEAVIVRIIDPDRRREPLDARKLSQRLGLSARQAQAVSALMKDGTEDLACARLGVSKATLHTYVNRVYARYGIRNRIALVALLASHGFDVTLGDEK